ncbi:MAG: AAA family ATPase [Anaerolineaceae bacterium]|nr:AAA family ATPase [Anaerolineaceae bacterium]
MSGKPKIYKYKSMTRLTQKLRYDLNSGAQNFVLLFAYNGTGKTRLSMAFKDTGKKKGIERDTLYFNAFTEDLFNWDNDLEGDSERVLKINSSSRFFAGVEELEMENRIRPFLHRYGDFDFSIDYEQWTIDFSRDVQVKVRGDPNPKVETVDNIKVSRGEENIFIWCFFLAIAQLAIDGAEAYNWVKYIYIDDPISSLDDNNAIALASDLAQLLIQGKDRMKTVISSHHGLFFNVMCNELKKLKHKKYFLYKSGGAPTYFLQATDDTPFFHHVAMLTELQQAANSGQLYTYHFNMLRSILEKTATFFGFNDFSACIQGVDDEILYARALNLLSHGKYSVYEPREMVDDTKELFKKILTAFLDRYRFDLPALITKDSK